MAELCSVTITKYYHSKIWGKKKFILLAIIQCKTIQMKEWLLSINSQERDKISRSPVILQIFVSILNLKYVHRCIFFFTNNTQNSLLI